MVVRPVHRPIALRGPPFSARSAGTEADPVPSAAGCRLGSGRRKRTGWKRVGFLLLGNLFAFSAAALLAEVAFRMFLSPRYWIHCDRWLVGSGQTEAGKKWWPSTSYRVDGSEFRTEFRTDARGYRARPDAMPAGQPYRLAMVGESFTEAMQVPYATSFCARIERLLNQGAPTRPRFCINYGVSATDLFDYWHRIVHDVLSDDPPEALVLCLYPGNDFQSPSSVGPWYCTLTVAFSIELFTTRSLRVVCSGSSAETSEPNWEARSGSTGGGSSGGGGGSSGPGPSGPGPSGPGRATCRPTC